MTTAARFRALVPRAAALTFARVASPAQSGVFSRLCAAAAVMSDAAIEETLTPHDLQSLESSIAQAEEAAREYERLNN